MVGVFSRSWKVTKLTFGVMNKDKELYVYPVLSFFVSIVWMILAIIGTLAAGLFALSAGVRNFGYLEYLVIFVMYLGLFFIQTFFSTCVVYTAGTRFAGKNATLGSSIGFSFKRIHKIFLWSLIAATFGLIMKILSNFAKKIKGVGGIVIVIINAIFGFVWEILTIFVIQGIAYDNLGPFAAIKQSAITLRKTWGESLIRYVGFGLAAFIFVLIGLAVGVPLIILSISIGAIYVIIAVGIVFLYFLALSLTFSIAAQVYNTALYVYASTGVVPEGYDEDVMVNAFKKKEPGLFK